MQGDLRVAIYTRVSRDKTGEGLAVERQEQDCRQLAESKGWQIVAVLTENDTTAFSGKIRPVYEQLIGLIESGQVDAVVAWSHDRLHRRPTELERFIDVSEKASVNTYTVKAGHFDLSTPSGRAIARTLAAWASYEVETSTSRVLAAKLQQAKAGQFSGGQRPYGYTARCEAFNEPEAAVIRKMVDMVIGGASFRTVALALNEMGILTQHGADWNALKIRNILSHKRYVGIREHHDMEYPAKWPALLDRETWDELQTAITVRRSMYKQRGSFRKYTLRGFVHCGLCGMKLSSSFKCTRTGDSRPVWTCTRDNVNTGRREGCGRISRMIAPIEELVKDCIFARLDSPDFSSVLANHEDDAPRVRVLLQEQAAQQVRINELVDDYATGLLSRQQLSSAKLSADNRMREIEQQISTATSSSPLSGIPTGQALRDAWDKADIEWRRSLVAMFIDKIVILPKPKPYKNVRFKDWWFDPNLIQILWRV